MPAEQDTLAMATRPRLVEGLHVQQVPYVQVIAGLLAGQVYCLDRPETLVGRDHRCHIVLGDPGVSRQHAMFHCSAQGQVTITDLGSKNGTFIGEEQVSGSRRLTDHDRVAIGSVWLKFAHQDCASIKLVARMFDGATRDHLTGALSADYFTTQLEQERAVCRNQQFPLSLLLVELDQYCPVEQAEGRAHADVLLRDLAARLREGMRLGESLARLGNQFAVLMPHNDRPEAAERAEAMRSATERAGQTITVGLASGADQDLLTAAEQALHRAREAGRNRVA